MASSPSPSNPSTSMATRSTPSSSLLSPSLPLGNSPYARAKHVQMVDKDLNKAVSLFWTAINSGDRVDSALKDMVVVMKQVNRADEAIEAIKSFRSLCSQDSQDPLDNLLLDLYKKCGRINEEIELLRFKLKIIDDGLAFGGRSTKMARSHGKLHSVSVNQEKARLLGNLAWAYMQVEKYKEAEAFYWQALDIEPDYNKQCNLAICLMQTGKVSEAKSLLRVVPKPSDNCSADSYLKSFERAWEMVKEYDLQSYANDREAGTNMQVQRITPMVDNSNLSNDYSRPSPSYSTPQSDFKTKRRFHPPLSVNRSLKHMPKELQNVSTTCKNKNVNFGKPVWSLVEEQYHTPSIIGKAKKTWADIVEEEEKELSTESEVFLDENVNLNILQSNPQDLKSQDFTRKFSQKLNVVDQKRSEGTETPRTGTFPAQRSLFFNLEECSARRLDLKLANKRKIACKFSGRRS